MDNAVLIGLIAGIFGAVAAGVPAYFAQRNAPSRKVSDTASIVDSTGKVVTMYRAEIDRLDAELQEARTEIKAMKADLAKRPTRDVLLETVAELKTELEKRPTKEELIATVAELQATVQELSAKVTGTVEPTPGTGKKTS